MCWRSKPANRVLRSGNDISTSLTPTEPRSADRQLSILLLRVLVKIEGGANIGTAHLQR